MIWPAQQATRLKSSSARAPDEDTFLHETPETHTEVVSFPVTGDAPEQVDSKPVLLNSKEHAVGYLSRILNARVYEAAVETDLQEAKNLSAVRPRIFFVFLLECFCSSSFTTCVQTAAPEKHSLIET